MGDAASEEHKKRKSWTYQKVTDALVYHLYKIYTCIRFRSKLYRIPMGTNCAPLLLICFYFAIRVKSLKKKKKQRYDMIDAFNSTSGYLDDLLNIDNIHFEHIVYRIYPAEHALNKANYNSDTEAVILDFNLPIQYLLIKQFLQK